MQHARLIKLLEKYLEGTCSPEELAAINQWYNDLPFRAGQASDSTGKLNKPDAEDVLQALRKLKSEGSDFEERMYSRFTQLLASRAASQAGTSESGLMNRPHTEQIPPPFDSKLKHRSVRRNWLRYAAAITILIGLSWWTVIYFNARPDHFHKQAHLKYKENAQQIPGTPGQNKAILRLANGQTILLDTLKNGLVAIQGDMHLVNSDGTLNFSKATADIGSSDNTARLETVGTNTLQTAAGEQYKIILPDGTKVWLNAASSITFPSSFSNQPNRTVKLDGEAYFEVIHNARQPFLVQTKMQTIEDIGTAFNVSAYNDDPSTKTTLLEGAVNIKQTQHPDIPGKPLVPGQQATLKNNPSGPSTTTLIKVKTIATAGVVAWKNGYFQFDGEDIETIMRKVSRWYKVQVIYDTPVPPLNMEGSMDKFKHVSQILSIIEKTGHFQFKMIGNTIHVRAT